MKVYRDLVRVLIVLVLVSTLLSITSPAHAAGTTITVNSLLDNATVASLAGDGVCELREAVENANTNSQLSGSVLGDCLAGSTTPGEVDTIAFDLSGSGVKTITLLAYLDITDKVIIDGTTDPAYVSTPVVRLDGNNVNMYGLDFDSSSDGSILKGVMITQFGYSAVLLFNSDNTKIVGNYIGTDGSSDLGCAFGINADESNNDIIGGPTATDRNVITGNSTDIQLYSGSTGVVIQGNFIGVYSDGVTSPTGSQRGILMTVISSPGFGSPSNTIGGLAAGEGNVIAGHSLAEIDIYSDEQSFSDNNVIQGNIIGINAAGNGIVGVVSGDGINIVNSDSTLIESNVISGKTGAGIHLKYDPSFNQGGIPVAPDGTVIKSNKIGTSQDGLSALGNGKGILIGEATNSTIGVSSDFSQRNIISGNQAGIEIDAGAGNVVDTNTIGMDAASSGSIPNTIYGLNIATNAGVSRNWIANSPDGIYLTGSGAFSSANHNCVTGSTTHGIENATASNVTFTNSWWGTGSGPSGTNDVSGLVTASPFLTDPAPVCSPVVSLNSISLNYGNQLVGTSSALKTITLTNTGDLQMHLTSITMNAPFGRDVSSTCPSGVSNLIPGASCTIKIKFSPTATGLVTHNLTINTNVATSPNHVTLTGTGVAGTALLKNPGFEIDANHDNKPDNWSFTNFNLATDSRDCAVRKNGICSLKLGGDSLQKVASQTITKSGVAGDDFTFSLWSKSNATPALSIYRLQVLFYKGTVLKGNTTKNVTTGSHPFQKVSGTFTAPTAYTKIVYKIIFKANSGTAWFDSATLNWAP